MIKLIDILKEIEDEQIDVSALKYLGPEIEKELNSQNEVVGTSIALLALAMPGMVKATAKIAGIIAKKSGLKVAKSPAWYEVVQAAAEKVDSYLDAPFNKMLEPFIDDDQKRAKAANIFKAVALIGTSFAGAVDPGSIATVKSTLSDLVGNSTSEVLQTAYEKGAPELTKAVKELVTKI